MSLPFLTKRNPPLEIPQQTTMSLRIKTRIKYKRKLSPCYPFVWHRLLFSAMEEHPSKNVQDIGWKSILAQFHLPLCIRCMKRKHTFNRKTNINQAKMKNNRLQCKNLHRRHAIKLYILCAIHILHRFYAFTAIVNDFLFSTLHKMSVRDTLNILLELLLQMSCYLAI